MNQLQTDLHALSGYTDQLLQDTDGSWSREYAILYLATETL